MIAIADIRRGVSQGDFVCMRAPTGRYLEEQDSCGHIQSGCRKNLSSEVFRQPRELGEPPEMTRRVSEALFGRGVLRTERGEGGRASRKVHVLFALNTCLAGRPLIRTLTV
ncbi:unnamed protein product [Ectocarpus sp. 8 AP-2014]